MTEVKPKPAMFSYIANWQVPRDHWADMEKTRTNLQTAGASLGRDRPKRTMFNSLHFLPSQDVGPGTEPLLYAATSPSAVPGGYYGPGGTFGLVGPTIFVRPPRRARDTTAAARLWAEAERLTGVRLPAGAIRA